MFNSLKCVKLLEEVGVSRAQAETHVQIMSELVESNLVTGEQFKEGVTLLQSEFNSGIFELRNELKSDIIELRNQIVQSEYRQTIKLGTIISIAMTVLFAAIKLT